MNLKIISVNGQLRWNAVAADTGALLGTVYKDGDHGGYVCTVGSDSTTYSERAAALLALSLKTDTKEGVCA